MGDEFAVTSVLPADKTFHKNLKKILHLWEIPVISNMRINFPEMPGNLL
jgi:hypothetical protein